ncbi:Alpha/Beta hydrolase protein [Irpex rosettiformis]|uniref:Alpha/Beta hydrolase protein n=1 Tax=Irpex rosettiformis TaxID=378272 RepID=A0ACB8U7V3_9APHY|nr:Alpha/Beta hydrolase protein [Irpex rosettiformis]
MNALRIGTRLTSRWTSTNTPRPEMMRSMSTIRPVDLPFDKYLPSNGNETDQPLVILHGLFGMKRNWASLAKAFARDLQRPVYALDLRNHGEAPHVRPMTYSAMAVDVLEFFRAHSLRNVSLLGHSMGGKVAMCVALDPDLQQDLLTHLIVADIAPSKGALSPEFQRYVEAMKKIEDSKVSTRQEAQQILTPYESDAMTRAFLLTNLLPAVHDHHHHALKFRVPIDIIGEAIPEIGNFPCEPGEQAWEGPTIFIKGTRSKYINHHNIPIAEQFFPNMKLRTLDAGHWGMSDHLFTCLFTERIVLFVSACREVSRLYLL